MTGQLAHWAAAIRLDALMKGLAEKRRATAYDKLLADFKDYLHRQVKSALHASSDAVRIVTEIRMWVHTQEHLLSLCDEPECDRCTTRRSMLDGLGSLLPRVHRTSGDPAGEVTGMGSDFLRGGEDGDRSGNRGDDRDW